jgi:signal peptidase I
MIQGLYGLLLYAYPKRFRDRFGVEMRQVFRDRWRAASATRKLAPRMAFLSGALKDWFLSCTKERLASMQTTSPRRLWRAARATALAALTLVIGLLIFSSFVQAFVITAGSMEASLQAGDHILVKLGHDAPIRQGDMVVFRYPEDRNQAFVKRVIGVSGDHIRLIDKQVIRNGRRLIEPYVQHVTANIDGYRDNFPAGLPLHVPPRGLEMLKQNLVGGEIVVPADSFFLLGDNRDTSLDSRYWGFISREDIIGRPLLVYWSYDKGPEEMPVGGLPKHFFTRTRWDRTLHLLGPASPLEVEP